MRAILLPSRLFSLATLSRSRLQVDIRTPLPASLLVHSGRAARFERGTCAIDGAPTIGRCYPAPRGGIGCPHWEEIAMRSSSTLVVAGTTTMLLMCGLSGTAM